MWYGRDPVGRAALARSRFTRMDKLCDKYAACFCSGVQPSIDHDEARVWRYRADADRVQTLILSSQQTECGSVSKFVRVHFPAYGMGGAIWDHLRRLLPVWQHLFVERAVSQSTVAVPTYDHFAANQGDTDAFLWTAFDDTLPCRSWFGCYWEPLVRACNVSMPPPEPVRGEWPYMTTSFEQRWGPVLFASALLRAWWRPTGSLQRLIDDGVNRVFHGSALATSGGRTSLADDSPERCVALHVRRGDACKTQWRRCPPLDDFVAAASVFAQRLGLTSLFVASDDHEVITELRSTVRHAASNRTPWNRVYWQSYDRRPYNVSWAHGSGTRFWVEQRLRWARAGDRPLGRRPVLEFLVDLESAAQCSALVGTMDSHGSRLMLLRMASRMGVVPPFYSLVGRNCPMTGLSREVRGACESHTTSNHGDQRCEALRGGFARRL